MAEYLALPAPYRPLNATCDSAIHFKTNPEMALSVPDGGSEQKWKWRWKWKWKWRRTRLAAVS